MSAAAFHRRRRRQQQQQRGGEEEEESQRQRGQGGFIPTNGQKHRVFLLRAGNGFNLDVGNN